MMAHLQPYRVDALQGGAGDSQGLLTGYYEPVLEGSRVVTPEFAVPLYRPPVNLAQRKPWCTRQEIDTCRGCKKFCVNGQLAGNCCTPMELQINDRNERTDRQPAG